MSLAKRLRTARVARGLDVTSIAERLKVSVGSVRHHENGVRVPKTHTIALYSRIYGVSVDWILRGAGKGPTPDDTADFMDIWDAIPETARPLALDVLRPFSKAAKSTGKGD